MGSFEETYLELIVGCGTATHTLNHQSGMTEVLPRRYGAEFGEAGSSDLTLRSGRSSSDRSSRERRSQPYRTEADDLEQDISLSSQFPSASGDLDQEQRFYVYDAKEDIEKSLPPYGPYGAPYSCAFVWHS